MKRWKCKGEEMNITGTEILRMMKDGYDVQVTVLVVSPTYTLQERTSGHEGDLAVKVNALTADLVQSIRTGIGLPELQLVKGTHNGR